MSEQPRRARAIGLVSGGLDSTLALALMLKLGVEVRPVHFYTGLCITETQRRLGGRRRDGHIPRNEALRAGQDLKIEIEMIDVSGKDYLDVITQPKYGYGANANPCIDCRSFMLRHAKRLMEEDGADFVFTGEVLGQRPMSQRRWAMGQVADYSGLGDRLLRPLSAQLLPPTWAEQEGLVDRSQLLALSGRSRKPQIKLAEAWGLTDYPQPAGGCCYLADPGYGRRFQDLMEHKAERALAPEEATLLAAGRHFRLSARAKLIVARSESENAVLVRYAGDRYQLEAEGVLGPTALVEGDLCEEQRLLASRIVARYGKGRALAEVKVVWRREGQTVFEHVVPPMEVEADLGEMMV